MVIFYAVVLYALPTFYKIFSKSQSKEYLEFINNSFYYLELFLYL